MLKIKWTQHYPLNQKREGIMKVDRFYTLILVFAALAFLLGAGAVAAQAADKIIHDAEYYIIEAQNGEKWAADDKQIDEKLAEIREKNGGKRPNIVYILLDDVGFGEIGMDDLSVIRGYKTPRMSQLATEGISLQRMYSEPSCTPTRVAMMTGRYPIRTGLTEAKATVAGDGLPAEEVTLAEVLRDSGYYTSHVGKWHMGDIEQAMPAIRALCMPNSPFTSRGSLPLWAETWSPQISFAVWTLVDSSRPSLWTSNLPPIQPTWSPVSSCAMENSTRLI
jgi:hypothetical protein